MAAAGLGFAAMLALIGLRMPVGLAMLLTGSAGYIYLANASAFLNYMKSTPYFLFSNYTLSVIPLFILMGAFAERSGLATDLFKAASGFVGHLRGGLAMAVIGACTGFGAICGSSVATTATFGRAALPELRRYRYGDGLATGTIAVGGTLGILIPPSVILVVYAISTEQNIAKLFQAALIPGLLAALFYCLVIALVVRRDPAAGPAHPPVAADARWRALVLVWPALVVALVVVGGIYGGIFTPTEGASVGAVSMFAIGVLRGSLPWREIKASLLQTAETSALIFAILLGAEVFNAFLALSQLPTQAASFLGETGLPPYAILVGAARLLHPARRGDGRIGHDPSHPAGVLPDRLGSRFRPAARRGRHLVRHPRPHRRRHRPHGAADRAQRVRGQRHRPRRADHQDLSRRAALHRRRRDPPRPMRRLPGHQPRARALARVIPLPWRER